MEYLKKIYIDMWLTLIDRENHFTVNKIEACEEMILNQLENKYKVRLKFDRVNKMILLKNSENEFTDLISGNVVLINLE